MLLAKSFVGGGNYVSGAATEPAMPLFVLILNKILPSLCGDDYFIAF
jgi:hypothetical protein